MRLLIHVCDLLMRSMNEMEGDTVASLLEPCRFQRNKLHYPHLRGPLKDFFTRKGRRRFSTAATDPQLRVSGPGSAESGWKSWSM